MRSMKITLYFAFRLRFRLAPNCFYKTIDAFGGCLYPQPSYISRRPCGTLSNNEIGKAIEIPFERDEEDKCAL